MGESDGGLILSLGTQGKALKSSLCFEAPDSSLLSEVGLFCCLFCLRGSAGRLSAVWSSPSSLSPDVMSALALKTPQMEVSLWNCSKLSRIQIYDPRESLK